MASFGAAPAQPAYLILGVNRPSSRSQLPSICLLKLTPKLSQTPYISSFENAIRPQIRQKLLIVPASNSNPSGGDSIKDKSDDIASGAAQGPPFLTILAGFLVFLLVCWFFKSIIMWLFGLIVKVPPLK